jgi:hypothetical protein
MTQPLSVELLALTGAYRARRLEMLDGAGPRATPSGPLAHDILGDLQIEFFHVTGA